MGEDVRLGETSMTQQDADKLREQIKTLTTEQLEHLRRWIINEHFNRLHEETQGKVTSNGRTN